MTATKVEKQRLLDTVHAFAELAREKGFAVASREYRAEDAVMMVENHAPITGDGMLSATISHLLQK